MIVHMHIIGDGFPCVVLLLVTSLLFAVGKHNLRKTRQSDAVFAVGRFFDRVENRLDGTCLSTCPEIDIAVYHPHGSVTEL